MRWYWCYSTDVFCFSFSSFLSLVIVAVDVPVRSPANACGQPPRRSWQARVRLPRSIKAPAPVIFFSLFFFCHRRPSSILPSNSSSPFACCQNWPRSCIRLAVAHFLNQLAHPRRTGVGRATSSSSRTARAPPWSASPWPAHSSE
jgi:hypothetical protein